MALTALFSLLHTLERRFFTDTGHAIDIHPNHKVPDSFHTFCIWMFKFGNRVREFYPKLLDEEQQRVIIFPQDITIIQGFREGILRKYGEFEDEISDSSAYQGEGSAERCNLDLLCPLRQFQKWLDSLHSLTDHLDFFIGRLDEIEPQSIQMVKIEEKIDNVKILGPLAATILSKTGIHSEEDNVVGIEEEMRKIMHMVFGGTSSRLKIISIVGMGGIGKTTIARAIYRDNKVLQYFDVRIWITVSQIYDAREVLLSLLIAGKKEHQQLSVEELGIKVYQSLKYRRYLIIVDDIWEMHVWDDIKKLLPNDDNGSRVVLTTRQTDVALSAGSYICNVPLMDKNTSWSLLEKKIFGADSCPLELADIGSDIVGKCHGLPLTIVVIAGLLQADRTRAWWENIANDVRSAIHKSDEHHVFDTLSLSYGHLPSCLQPCLLYFVRFSEGKKISVSNLIKLWVAEGFLKPRGCKTLEETAYECLEDLIRRNLVSTNRKRRNGLPNKCFVHDLITEMCIKLSKGKFNPRNVLFLSIRGALYFTDQQSQHLEEGYELLRVLDVPLEEKDKFPCPVSQVCELLQLRYLSLRCQGDYFFNIPTNIWMFTNLETLVIYPKHRFGVRLPAEIWEIPKLRHLLVIGEGYLDYVDSESEASLPLESLETLLNIYINNGSVGILKRIPNIQKLGFKYHYPIQGSMHFIEHLVYLHHLESLHIETPMVDGYDWQKNRIFPIGLRKLTMVGVKLPWEYVGRILGSLPNLEVLKMKCAACHGQEWETTEGHFLKLKMLEIEDSDLETWRMESSSHFPRLEHLKLSYCWHLNELPWLMGDVETLELIGVAFSSKNVDEWAEAIFEQQQNNGNESFQLHRSVPASSMQTVEGNDARLPHMMALVHEGRINVYQPLANKE